MFNKKQFQKRFKLKNKRKKNQSMRLKFYKFLFQNRIPNWILINIKTINLKKMNQFKQLKKKNKCLNRIQRKLLRNHQTINNKIPMYLNNLLNISNRIFKTIKVKKILQIYSFLSNKKKNLNILSILMKHKTNQKHKNSNNKQISFNQNLLEFNNK